MAATGCINLKLIFSKKYFFLTNSFIEIFATEFTSTNIIQSINIENHSTITTISTTSSKVLEESKLLYNNSSASVAYDIVDDFEGIFSIY